MDTRRIDMPLFWDGKIKILNSPKSLDIVTIGIHLAKELNSLWHSRLPIYETGFCLNHKVSFGALNNHIFYAVAIWSNPVAANLPQKTWLELRRMAINSDAPKFTATYMLGKMRKFIIKNFPEITTLVSYQDMVVHSGTIYKADNWIEDKIHDGGSWNRPNSKNQSGTSRTRPDLNSAIGPKKRWIYKLKED